MSIVCDLRDPLVEEAQHRISDNNRDRIKHTASCKNYANNQFNDMSYQYNNEILNLSVSSRRNNDTNIVLPESEFSNSPKFLPNSEQIVQNCLKDNDNENAIGNINNNTITFLSNDSNFYKSTLEELKIADSRYIDTNLIAQQMLDEKVKELETENSLPFKKRRMSSTNANAHCYVPKDDISYPATPMISIAELEGLQGERNDNRSFKTPAERKEMPPLPSFINYNSTDPSPIIADQFNINNHTYNNPTINYHMGNGPIPFINMPYYSAPPFLVHYNNLHSLDSLNSSTSLYNNYNNNNGTNNNNIHNIQTPNLSVSKVIKKEKKKRSSKANQTYNYKRMN